MRRVGKRLLLELSWLCLDNDDDEEEDDDEKDDDDQTCLVSLPTADHTPKPWLTHVVRKVVWFKPVTIVTILIQTGDTCDDFGDTADGDNY